MPRLHCGNKLGKVHKPQRYTSKKGKQMSLRKERQECCLAPRRWRDSIALLFVLLFASVASAQTATVSVYAPPMPIHKKGVGLWQAQRQACVVTIVYSDGKK